MFSVITLSAKFRYKRNYADSEISLIAKFRSKRNINNNLPLDYFIFFSYLAVMRKVYYRHCKYCHNVIHKSETPICGFCVLTLINGVAKMKVQFEPFRLDEKGDKVRGIFKGICLEPWPAILIDDGTLWGLPAYAALTEYLEHSKLPIDTEMEVQFEEKIKLSNGRSFNKFRITVDEKTLPKDYDKSLLQPKIFNPATDKIDWDAIRNQKNFKETEQEELPF